MQMNKILGITSRRTWFDSPSNEFNQTNMEKKVLVLASLNYWGELEHVIADYQERYKEKEYIINSLQSTLLLYIKELDDINWGKYHKKRIPQLISTLKTLLNEKVDVKFSIDKLIEAHLDENINELKKQNSFFHIDLNENLSEKLQGRDKKENRSYQESYTHLYGFYQNILLPNYRKQNFASMPVLMGMDYQTEYVVSHFQLFEASKENYTRALKYIIKVLFFNNPPYHTFFIFRINLNDTVETNSFWTLNEVAIHFNTALDIEDWDKLQQGEQPKQQYIQRWKTLTQELINRDVIICASYKGKGFKMGIVRLNTEPTIKKSTNGFFLALPLENSGEIDLDLHPIVQGLIPSNVTISRIKKRNYRLRKIYHQMKVRLPIREFDSYSYEIMVNEWLRSNHAPEDMRLKFQLLKTGSSKKDIDIFGVSVLGEKMAVQVSDTSDSMTIMKKVRQLSNYEEFRKLFFFNVQSSKDEDVEIIDLKQVVNDLENDSCYKELVRELS